LEIRVGIIEDTLSRLKLEDVAFPENYIVPLTPSHDGTSRAAALTRPDAQKPAVAMVVTIIKSS